MILTLHISDTSPTARSIEEIAETEQVSREEAALKLLDSLALARPKDSSLERRNAIKAVSGRLKNKGWIMDEFHTERHAEIDGKN